MDKRIQQMIDSGHGLPPLGEPPEALSDDEIKAWNLISTNTLTGVLRRSDRLAVELAARLYVMVKNNPERAGERKHLHSLLYQLGLNKQNRILMGL